MHLGNLWFKIKRASYAPEEGSWELCLKVLNLTAVYLCCFFPHLLESHFNDSVKFSLAQSLSRVRLFVTLWTAGSTCPSKIPRVYSNSCPLSQWCHPTISSSVIPFSSCPQSFPASGSFQMSQLSASGGQSIGDSPSTSVLPMNTRDWSPLGWTDWISLQSKDSQEFSPTSQFKHMNYSVLSFLYSPTLTSTHDYWKNHSLD